MDLAEAQHLIMSARVLLGWVDPSELLRKDDAEAGGRRGRRQAGRRRPARRPEQGVTRGGRTKDRDGPERRCIVTRATGPKEGLIRFVLGPDDEVVPDLAGKLPGRGIWVAPTPRPLRRRWPRGTSPAPRGGR